MRDINLSGNENILISRTDKIGDVILALPVINETKRLLPDSKIYFLISKRLGNLIEGYKDIYEIIYLENFTDEKSFIDYLKQKKIDIAISLFPDSNLAKIFNNAEIKIRVGTAYRLYSYRYNYKIREHRKHSILHESDYNLNLLKFLGKEISYEKKFYFIYADDEYNKLKEKLSFAHIDSKFIIIHPGSFGSAFDLPVEIMIKLTRLININFPEYKIFLTGTENEKTLSKRFLENENNHIIDLCGYLGLRELMILIDKSSLFISNSTGPVHIAGALNKNIVCFYPNSAPMTPVRWRPLSLNAEIITPEKGDDMSAIELERIFETVSRFLTK